MRCRYSLVIRQSKEVEALCIVILIADDDEEDRMLACDALAESCLSNDIYCITDGEDLMDYLHRQGKYTSSRLDPAGFEYAEEGRS